MREQRQMQSCRSGLIALKQLSQSQWGMMSTAQRMKNRPSRNHVVWMVQSGTNPQPEAGGAGLVGAMMIETNHNR